MQPEILKTKPWEDGKAPNELYVPKGMVGLMRLWFPNARNMYFAHP
jgi:hypothetical protein